jgi:hypothetical protein
VAFEKIRDKGNKRIERSYRDFYNTMLVAESALYSTFPGHGEFTLLRKSAFAPMPPGYGSSDGNISSRKA